MPLLRCEVRNEYGLGQPELYREVNNEDPKAVLDGVAVAGLVGILRQLGDLAEFAAEVFHGIQEQVLITANRSHKLIVRVQNIEAKLPPLEKAVLAQTSHIHFAYTAGSRWHARIRENNNLFIYNDLPWFIMNSYEVCRDPPQLHLLDRFDSGGPGSCVKRYSDPTLFRRTSDNSIEFGAEKIQKVEKSHRAKKKRSSRRTGASVYTSASVSSQSGRRRFTPNVVNGHASPSHRASTAHRSSQRTEASAPSESLSNHSGRIKSTPSTHNELTSPSPTASTADMTIKSDVGDCSCSFDSRTRSSFIEYSLGSSETPEQQQSNVSSSFIHHHDNTNSGSLDRQLEVADYFPQKSSPEQIATSSSSFTWDEKVEVEVVEWWYTQQSDENEDPEILTTNSDLDIQQTKTDKGEDAYTEKALLAGENTSKSSSSDGDESEPDNYMDALNAIESESETDLDCQMKHEAEKLASCVDEEGVQEELNKAMMHVDEVPLKTDSMAVHGLFTENELTSDLVDSIFYNYAVHAKTSVRYAVESDSENDHDCQMNDEVEKLASCVDKEGLQEELNEARMHVEDEVPLKTESIAAHDLFTENELTSDILNPRFSNYVVHAEISDSEVTNSIPDHSPGFEGSKSSHAIDNSKGEFTVRNAVESELENDRDCQMKHDVEKVATCVDKEGVQEELSEGMVHVADEVTLKMESTAVHDLCSENEHISDILNSIFLNCAVQAETSENADAYLMPDHSPGFGCSKTSNAIDNSKGEFIVNNPVESESENDLDYQMKHCLDEEGVQEEELNEATVHIADEVTLKTESIAVRDRFTENEHTSDLLNSIFSNPAENAETYSMPDHSPGFECSKSSDAIDNSTGEFAVMDAVESESENDLDCQVKHEVQELDCCMDKEEVREELNEAMMHVADEVPLKAESIAVHDLFTENEQTCDLPNSIFLNCAVQVKTSENAETYSSPNHLPGFECSKSSDAIDNSKAEFTVSDSVESESQNDLDCQMKHEVKLACVDKEGVQEELNKATMHVADEIPLKAESISAHDLFSENEHTSDLLNSIFSIRAVQEETSGNAVTYSEPDHSPGFEGPKSSDAIEYSKAEFTVNNPLSETFSQDQLLSDKAKNASCNSQVSLDKTTSFRPVSLWTNGGLLGLEPSKPPDFVALGNSSRDSVTNEVSVVCPENHTLIVQDNCEKGKAEKLSTGRDLSSDDSTSRHGRQDVEIGKTKDSQRVDGSHRVYAGGVNEKGATPQNQLLPDANVEASSNEACPENDGNSFQIFPFGNRFFVNSFCRRMPSVTEVRLEPDSSLRLEQKGRHVNDPQTTHWISLNRDFGQEPFVESLTSSPPLEHMKISFHSLDGFESSKLQLKLPDVKSCNGSVRDMFLSFQLVPEPSTSLQVSDSEEDTFCRSSPYMSDESPSHHSESDSELWESGESLDRTDHLLYKETLGRISSIDLGSCCLDPEDISPNCLEHEPECKNACTENDANPPPSFNTLNSAPHEETENKLKTIGSQYLKVTSPMPPPLPPAQWVILKPPSAVENDQQHATSETGDQESDTKPLECTVHHRPKQELDDGQVNGEATADNANGKEQEKLSLPSEANNAANGKEIDRKEDFLHQIRAKSFMLKPSTTAKTLLMRDPTESEKFATRLLRKASAIRQAVGSDDGEDSWSDA